MSDVDPSYSVSFRLQRTTTEFAFVSVPVTDDLMRERPDGSWGFEVEKMVERAIEMAGASEVTWQPESCRIHLHPIQMAPPELEGPSQDTTRRKSEAPSPLKHSAESVIPAVTTEQELN